MRLHHLSPGMKHFFWSIRSLFSACFQFNRNLRRLQTDFVVPFCSCWAHIKCVTSGARFQVQVVTDGGVWGSKKKGSKNTVALVKCRLNVTEGGIRPTFHSTAQQKKLFFWLPILPKLTLFSKYHSLVRVFFFLLRHLKCFWPEGCMLHCCSARPAHWRTVAA